MPLPLQVTRFGRYLARSFGIQGQVPLTVVEDVAPVVSLIDHADADVDFLQQVARRGRTRTLAAQAALFGLQYLENPVGSPLLIVVEEVVIFTGGAGLFWIGAPIAAPGGGNTNVLPLDTRQGPIIAAGRTQTIAGVGVASNELNAATQLAANPFAFFGPGGQTTRFDPRMVLAPGTALAFEAPAVNTEIHVGWKWLEHPAAPQELAGG